MAGNLMSSRTITCFAGCCLLKTWLVAFFARWALSLHELDTCIIYRPGRKHMDTDALSRSPLPSAEDCSLMAVPILSPLTVADMPAEQRRDPWPASIMEVVSASVPIVCSRTLNRQAQHFALWDGLLSCHNYMPDGRRWLLVIPCNLQTELCASLHTNPLCRHAGVLKTLKRISQGWNVHLEGMECMPIFAGSSNLASLVSSANLPRPA